MLREEEEEEDITERERRGTRLQRPAKGCELFHRLQVALSLVMKLMENKHQRERRRREREKMKKKRKEETTF